MDIQQKFVKCFRNFSGQLDKTAIYESEGSVWGHNFVLTKILFVFSLCSSKFEQRIIGFFSSKTMGKIVTTVYHVSKKVFRRIFLEKFFFHHFELSDFCLSIRQKFVGPVVGTAFCVSIRPVCGEKFCPNLFSPSITDIDRKFISLCSNFFLAGGRHCILRVQGINLRTKNRFEKHLFVSFIICVPWPRKSRFFPENIQQFCQNR